MTGAAGADAASRRVEPAACVGVARFSTESRQGTGAAGSAGDTEAKAEAKSEETKHKSSGEDGEDRESEGRDPLFHTKAFLLSLGVGALVAGATHVALSVPAAAAVVAGPLLASLCVGLVAGSALTFVGLVVLRPTLPSWAPAAVLGAGCAGQGRAQEGLKASFRDEVLQEAARACLRFPAEVAEVACAAAIREFETNRIHLEVEHEAGGVCWRFRAQARRRWFWRPWEATYVEVASKEMLSLPGLVATAPPPQVRNWSSDGQASRWRVVWSRGAPYAPGRAPRPT